MPVVTRRQKAINDFVDMYQIEGEDVFNATLRATAETYADKKGIKGLKRGDICSKLLELCHMLHNQYLKFRETL